MTGEPDDISDEILRRLTVLTAAVLVCLLLSVGVGIFAISTAVKANDDNDRTTAALCTFRADLVDRVRQTDKFLVEHPKGFAGIPAATLRQSADGQRRTITSLQSLDCPET